MTKKTEIINQETKTKEIQQQKHLKDYLCRDKNNQLLYVCFTLDAIRNILTDWKPEKDITKEELKALKTALTWGNKFKESVLNRLDYKESERIKARIEKYDLFIVDEYSAARMTGKMQENLKTAHVDRDTMDYILEQIMAIHCHKCILHHSDCILHKAFYENYIEESGWDLPNCRYSYFDPTGEKTDLEELQRLYRLKLLREGAETISEEKRDNKPGQTLKVSEDFKRAATKSGYTPANRNSGNNSRKKRKKK